MNIHLGHLFNFLILAIDKSNMAAPKIQDFCPEMWFFLYNSKCIDFKPHKCIGDEYKVVCCGNLGTRHMSLSITVLEIQM